MDEPLARQLQRLTDKVAAGDVVFFIGAGFSLESEYNTPGVLIARLLAQFEAIVLTAKRTAPPQDCLAGLCDDLHRGIRATFRLKTGKADEICAEDVLTANVKQLQDSYYPINDWMCSAFQSLLLHWADLEKIEDQIFEQAQVYLARYLEAMQKEKWKVSTWPLPKIEFGRYRDLLPAAPGAHGDRVTAGKALFLDTMGFAEGGSMIGDPRAATLGDVIRSYRGRVRDRHAVLAWLALEGALPVILTTNYDLLLEGAYRLAGMDPLDAREGSDTAATSESTAPDQCWPLFNRRLRHFTPIAGAPQFFSHGDGHQSALILKIHGCVYDYRRARAHAAAWRTVLPRMVFTFREIQNWRDDSWSRDFVKTLLRTRTVVFAGYSGSDPVLHDTFRSVYEEMAQYRPAAPPRPGNTARSTTAPDTTPDGAAATAFFLDISPKREFHGLEILRAASYAAGEPHPGLTKHPNLINFFGRGGSFPNVDELMLLTFHLAYRRLQEQALESELRRVAYQLVGRPRSHEEAEAIVASFRKLWRGEVSRAAGFHTEEAKEAHESAAVARTRREFRTIVGWTVDFHRQLLREYTAADLLLRKPERASRVYASMQWPWYAPLNEHPEWGAWAVVVELALRNRAAAWEQRAGGWGEALSAVEPLASDRPAVLLRPTSGSNGGPSPRIVLTIEVPELRQRHVPAGALFRFRAPVRWSLRNHTVPWWLSKDPQRLPTTPGPETLWAWAAGLRCGEIAQSGARPQEFFADTARPAGASQGGIG